MPVTTNAHAFEHNILAPNGALCNLFSTGNYPPLPANFCMTDAIINEAKNLSGADLGVLAQLHIVLTQPGIDLKEKREGVRKILVAGLKYEGDSAALIDKIKSYALPQLAKFGNNLSYRYLFKVVSYAGMIALAGSLSAPPVALRQLLSYIRTASNPNGNGTWAAFAGDYDFDEVKFIRQLGGLFMSDSHRDNLAAQWSGGPFANGYSANATSTQAAAFSAGQATVQPTTDLSPSGLASYHANKSTTTTQGASMTAATTVNPVAKAIASMNPALKPVIDSVLSQSGVPMTIDQIVQEVNAKTEAENELARIRKESEETINDLRKAISAAKASPTTFTITQGPASIPAGKVDMVDAEKVFPMLAGIKLKIPMFTWDHAHPDVPEVNPDYILRKGMLLKALRCLVRNENMWFVGHTGSGKTTFVEQIAARLFWPVARVAFDSNVDRSELVGRMQLDSVAGGGTTSRWLPGILERAIAGNYILLCDEMDAGHPNSLYTLQPILEGKPLTLLEDGGRIVQRAPLSRICATGNTAGNGDTSGLYPACRILSAATLDRFQEFIEVPYISQQEEEKLILAQAPGLKKAMVTKLVKFAAEMRAAFLRMETPISYSPRRSVAFARAVEDFFEMGIKDEKVVLSMAFRSKLYDAASEDFRQRITEIANNSLGGVDPTVSVE